MIYIVLFLLFLLFGFLNAQFVDPIFLLGDEYSLHLKLVTMYESLLTLDFVSFFGSGHYVYGFIYFFLILFLSLPFFILDYLEGVVWVARMVSVCFSLGFVFVSYRIFLRFLSQRISLLLSCVFLLIPFFWNTSLFMFKPDSAMIFFLFCTLFFWFKDDFDYGKYYWFGVLSLGFSLAFKLQALVLLVYPFYYCFYPLLIRDFNGWDKSVLRFLQSLLLIFGVYTLGNPYVLHPLGFFGIKWSFLSTLNKYIDSSDVSDSLFSFLISGFHDTLLPWHFVIFLFVLFFIFSFSVIKKKEKNLLLIIGLSSMTLFFYFRFFVEWSLAHTFALSLLPLFLVIIVVLKDIPLRKQYFMSSLIVLLIFMSFLSFFLSFNDRFKLYRQRVSELHFISSNIVTFLDDKISKDAYILLSDTLRFDYEELNWNSNQVIQLIGPLSHWMLSEKYYQNRFGIDYNQLSSVKPFYVKDFIILDTRHSKNERSKDFLENLKLDSIHYKKIYEGSMFSVFQLI